MPKAHDRATHFESISNENLIKYMHGTPISIVSGKPIKFGSHEHQHQMRAIKKIMLKRRLEGHKLEKQVSFQDSESKQEEVEHVEKPRKQAAKLSRIAKGYDVRDMRDVPNLKPMYDPIMEAAALPDAKPAETRQYPPIPKEALLNDFKGKENEHLSVPQHLQNIFIPSFANNKAYY